MAGLWRLAAEASNGRYWRRDGRPRSAPRRIGEARPSGTTSEWRVTDQNHAVVRACSSSSFTVVFPEYDDAIIHGQLVYAKLHRPLTRALAGVPVDEIGHALAIGFGEGQSRLRYFPLSVFPTRAPELHSKLTALSGLDRINTGGNRG